MGYYTRHEFEIQGVEVDVTSELLEEMAQNLNNISGYTFESDGGTICYDDEMKWYNHHKDMIKLSSKYKGILFKLEGEGEEQGDHWKNYYINGTSQQTRAKITFEAYDPKKMK